MIIGQSGCNRLIDPELPALELAVCSVKLVDFQYLIIHCTLESDNSVYFDIARDVLKACF
jgi:hypothetical protein